MGARRESAIDKLISKRLQELPLGGGLLESLQKTIDDFCSAMIPTNQVFDDLIEEITGSTQAILEIESRISYLDSLRWLHSDPTLTALIEIEIRRLESEKTATQIRNLVRHKPTR